MTRKDESSHGRKIINRNSDILLVFLIISAAMVPVSGNIPSHINPLNATASNTNLQAQQLLLINELLSYWSGIFISLNKGDIKAAQENFDNYLRILQENENILIEIKGDVYTELKKSGYLLNLTVDQTDQLRMLYEEGKLAYQNNQTDKAIQIALRARDIIGNLSSLQQELIMNAVAQYSGVNTTLYQTGLSSFDNILKEVQKRWRTVELTLFDETDLSLSVSPSGGELKDAIYINGKLTLPRNGSGIPDAKLVIKIDNETIPSITTDKNGKYNFTYVIPAKKPGIYPIQADFIPIKEPFLPASAKGSFFIKSTNTTLTIAVNPKYGEFGDVLRLSGNLTAKNASGFADADIGISLYNKTLVNVKTDEKGSYGYDFKIPMIVQGEHTVNAEFVPSEPLILQSSNKTTIRVVSTKTTLTVKADPGYGEFGDVLRLSGRLLGKNTAGLPDAEISVSLNNKTLANLKTDENGSYGYDFKVPMINEGENAINAEFIPSGPLLLRSSNKITIRAMQTNTTLIISGPKIAYQQGYLNLTGKLLTDNNLEIPTANLTVLLDKEEIGTAIVNNGDFFFSYWIDNKIRLGSHILVMKFNGKSLFLPSENSISVEIKTKPVFYAVKQKTAEILEPKTNQNILFLTFGIIGIIISIIFLRKEKWMRAKINTFDSIKSRILGVASTIKAGFNKATTKVPQTMSEPFKEAEIVEEKPVMKSQPQKQDTVGKVYTFIEDLIRQKLYKESISFSYKNARDHITTYYGIKNTPQLTHWEFYGLVEKSTPSVADNLLELTELYENAMYSNKKMDAGHAVKAINSFKEIYKLNNE